MRSPAYEFVPPENTRITSLHDVKVTLLPETATVPPVAVLATAHAYFRPLASVPPNVAGWPGGPAWFGSSSLVARVALAELVAKNTAPDAEAMAAAASGSTADLAAALGLPDGDFGAVTVQALARAGSPAERLALALVSPEFMIA